jgi:glycosyltransferase involved in cell wall biosynthesis
MEYARARSLPAFLEVNAPLIEEQAEFRGLIDRAGALASARRAFEAATVLFAVSDEVASYLNLFSETRGKVHVVPNAVSPERFPEGLRPSLPAPPGTFTVGFLGSMKPWHGVEDLVAAFAKLRAESGDNRLLLVGDGPARTPVEAQVRAQGLAERVHFTGAVEPAKVPGLLASMDVAVAPYRPLQQFYFSPLKVYEYMAAGLSVVASAVGQLNQLIEPEINGLLVPPGDVPALANALERLRKDPEKRTLLGRAGRRKVLAHHTWDALARRIVDLAGRSPGQHQESSSPSLRHAAT